ncbi:uncharacterized protein F4807DRAFT_384861 [Annulohypoxylon truncatum]|uniref:uncharacterized protein n=1 Tax=Annulohypoxylon truncatum TaxID=327061 RepID=UPI002007A03D|nr:uncharacterized protein F4807DRAFT_384861 [Annulohypoxylon truncatum]KAI1211999.1 hypothetical protein F4807DRAFT_384861 [Annulohypoxylon truncatum]
MSYDLRRSLRAPGRGGRRAGWHQEHGAAVSGQHGGAGQPTLSRAGRLAGAVRDVGLIRTFVGVAAAMAYYVYEVDLGRPDSCGMWFRRQFWMVGAAFVAGFVGE